MALPKVYLHKEDAHGNCDCGSSSAGGLREIDVQMKVEEGNILVINLFEFGAMPRLGSAEDLAAVRVHVRGKDVTVFAIYNDPLKTATMACCSGSGCTCYAHGCHC